MEQRIKQLIEQHFGAEAWEIRPLGGGFYGRAFLVRQDKPPFVLVVKLYLFPGLARKEALQVRTLSRHCPVKMPEIYFDEETQDGMLEAIGMEYFDGVNAGNADLTSVNTKQLGDEMTDVLIALHDTGHSAGFGALDAAQFVSDWRELYRPLAQKTLKK
ncbi:MAG: phosphotransferase, partial [Eubacteriales bacterium]|nr:phosphotransferase [Eubacteriales bacterium]